MEVAKTLDTTDPNPCKNQGGIAIVEPTPYTLKIRSGCEGGGKGALVQVDKSATLATNNDQYLFQPVTLEPGIAAREGGHIYEGVCGTLRAEAGDNRMAVAYSIENHPADSRVNIDDSGKVQTLTSRMGTGGCNVPMVMEPVIDVEMEVAVRKYEVDQEKLVALLRRHKGAMSNREIAEKLGKPVTMVEHWFRTDKCAAIPDPDVWYKLKALLGIETKEFDPCITEFEFKGGNYDMRNRIYAGDVSPTLTCGSGNDLHLVPKNPRAVLASGKEVAGCLMASGYEKLGAQEMFSGDYTVVEQKPVYCLQGNGIDRADTAGCNGKGWKEDSSYTLNTIDRPAVAYATDVGFFNSLEEQSPTLLARGYKDPHLVTFANDTVHYIVRRLTPTECARLQGFADRWGDIDEKETFTPEEFQFWHDVRNTHATVIGGKDAKEYTESQMLTWYNRLHTDSAEYKMWGNGIALPPALYVLQGMAEAFEKEVEDDWML